MNTISLKNPDQLARMREAGRLLAAVFAYLDEKVVAGVSTLQINDWVERYIVDVLQARPASKGQYGYAYVLNASVGRVVCHGVPSTTRFLRDGEIVNIDITLEKHGYIADSSKMYRVGWVSPQAGRLVDQAYQSMWQGIGVVRPGATLGDIGHAIQHHAESQGYSVVREYCGHGIGTEMHEAPQVLHYGRRGSGLVLKAGMTFTIEPMINQGRAKVRVKPDGWTVVTADKKLSAQWEHTIAVTLEGYEVLTLRDEERWAPAAARAGLSEPA